MSSSALGNEPEHITTQTLTHPSPGPSKMTMGAWIALRVLLTAELMNMLDQSVVLTALPAIQESTGAGPVAVQWLTTAYSLPIAVGLITGGRLGDIYGRRRILLIGTVVFTAASLLSGLAIVLILFPLTEGHAQGRPPWCFVMLAVGVLVLGVCLRHQRRRQGNAPMVTLSLFRVRQFSGGMAADLTHGLLCGLFFMTWTLYLQRGLGLSPLEAAVAFVLLSVGELGGATVAAKTAGRFARRLPQAGALIATAAMVTYGLQIGSHQADLTLLAMTPPVVLIGFGLGMVSGPLADLSLARVPPEDAGSASGLFNTAIHLGIALGTALTSVVFFAVTGGSPDGAVNRNAFVAVLWWVGGLLALMWALMFCLPKQADNQAD
ncbi:MFS transporter [Streptomyces sp. DSM 116496]|uniref:MFS transporter n=1 Tax=Streptomyces stoeckheimensis TaxID=3344656 RepID=UPI0038B29C2F